MRVALAVIRVLPDRDANLAAILSMAREAADAGADLVVFPEAALTGLINNDDPTHDLPLGEPIPGPITDVLGGLVQERCIWLAIGLLEREGDGLFDSAVLFRPDGEIGLKYRRISPQWHYSGADPAIYRQGTELSKVATPFGTFAFLICGDLFHDRIVRRVRDLGPDWLLFPFARGFDEDCCDEEQWEREEQLIYAQRARLAGSTVLMTNYIADEDMQGGGFGGAMVASSDGTVLDSLPLGRVGALIVDL